MQDVTPFDWMLTYEEKPPEKFYLIEVTRWEWTKTDDLSNDKSEPFYDRTREGRLFCAEKNLCPLCGYEAVSIGASAYPDNDISAIVRDWACLRCGLTGDVVGSYGRVPVLEGDNIQGDWAELPTHVVVTVDK